MPHKGASMQCHNQQVLAKPHHQPSNRDQQVREKLQQKVKIKSRAYIQLGEEVLQTVHRTFQPDIPIILHLWALADGSLDTNSTSTPTLFVIQKGLNCLETTVHDPGSHNCAIFVLYTVSIVLSFTSRV